MRDVLRGSGGNEVAPVTSLSGDAVNEQIFKGTRRVHTAENKL